MGPGSYSPGRVSSPHGISLGSRHPDPFERARVFTPSPDAYSAQKDRFAGEFCGKVAGMTIGERFPGLKAREATRGAGPGSEPGPGSFSPSQCKDRRIGIKLGGTAHSSSPGARVGTRSPGPAAYDLRKEKEDRYEIFSRRGSKQPHMIPVVDRL